MASTNFDYYKKYIKKKTDETVPSKLPTVFFNDGQRKIDYVLVYSKTETQRDRHKIEMISSYITNIKVFGLQTEEEEGAILDDLVCVKVHAPKAILNKYTNMYGLELTQNNPNYKFTKSISLKCMRCMATCPDVNDPIYQRAFDTLSGNRPTDFTNAERIFLVNKILCQINYGATQKEVGYEGLVKRSIFLGVYPLHDSLCRWPAEGPLTDRHLLAKYWANVLYAFKYQPLSIIENYYGPEVAFYFAWTGYYTKLLFFAAVIGSVSFAAGILDYLYLNTHMEEEVCNSDQMLCPVCPSDKTCKTIPLKNSCSQMQFAHVLENPITVMYCTIMSLWGILFMVFWNRKQAMLKVRWNLQENREEEIRSEYLRTAPLSRISSLTGNIEYFFPFWHVVGSHILSYAITLLMVISVIHSKILSKIAYVLKFFLYCLAVFVVMYYRIHLTYFGTQSANPTFRQHISLFESISSMFLTLIIMAFFNSFKDKVCKKMTELETPRTQLEYLKRYRIKTTLLSFGNIFFPIAYIAFFKGRFYTHPGDATQWTFFGMFKADVCKVSGCLADLSLYLSTIFIMKNATRLLTEIMMPIVTVFLERKKHNSSIASQWEEDFVLVQPQINFLYSEYITMVVQYGFMTFFLVSLPIAPLLAFISNVVELRLDAIKILRQYRRTVRRNVPGIEEWNIVLQVITVLGCISNPLVIAFGSNFIQRYLYWISNEYTSQGYLNSTLSDFDMRDYPGKLYGGARSTPGFCQYVGQRYPPSHPEKYQLTKNYWYQFAMKSVFFMVLENICLLFSLFLKYVIPEIPRKVKLRLEYDQKMLQEARLKTAKS